MKEKPYRILFYIGLKLVQALIVWLPRKVSLRLGTLIGWAAFRVARRERERTIQHLGWVYGREKTPHEIRKMGERVFIHFAEAAIDALRLPWWTREELNRLVEGKENLSCLGQARAEGKGVVLLTAHFGNWELMGAFLSQNGYGGTVVARKIYYEPLDQMMIDLRKEINLETLYQDAPPREFLKRLNENKILGILADQDIDRMEGIFVPFFGRPAYTLTAPVKFALATGAPIVPTFLVREGDRYRLLVEEPIHVERRSSREETIEEFTAKWSKVIEEKIRAYPDQWAWMHRRWKTEPRQAPSLEMVRNS